MTYEKTYKRFVTGILYLNAITYLIGEVLYFSLAPVFEHLLYTGVFFNVIAIIIAHIFPAASIRKLIGIYVVILLGLLFFASVYSMIVFWPVMNCLVWFISIPVALYVILPFKTVVKWSAVTLLLMILSTVLSYLFYDHPYFREYREYYYMSKDSIFFVLIPRIVHTVSFFLLICYCLYYSHKFYKINIREAIEATGEKASGEQDAGNDEHKKYEKIYRRIVEYFETEQPYLDPDFTLSRMAYSLNINISYLSKAIRKEKNMNFNTFVNFYRIEHVKKMIQSNPWKYTLQYVYLASGFNSQTAFNKAFKMQENITPSEYMQLHLHDRKPSE
jgi:AraC-like DNA-binding protein